MATSNAWALAGLPDQLLNINNNVQPTGNATGSYANDIALYQGSIYTKQTRTGGTAQYGSWLGEYLVTADVPYQNDGEYSLVNWATYQQISGAAVGQGWMGLNSPWYNVSSTDIFTASAGHQPSMAVLELNMGNRWGNGAGGDSSLQTDIGTGSMSGLYLVPDIVPSTDNNRYSPIAQTLGYSSHFAQVISPSSIVNTRHWWVGTLVRPDAIHYGGYTHLDYGGSTSTNVNAGSGLSQSGPPAAWTYLSGYFQTGLDMHSATFTNAGTPAIYLPPAANIVWYNGVSGGCSMNSNDGLTVGISSAAGGTTYTSGLYVNNYTNAVVRCGFNGSLGTLGFFTAASLSPQISGYGTPTGGAHQASFAAGSITLPNLAAAVAQLILDLKTYNLIGF